MTTPKCLLLAMPQLQDPFFFRTVSLLSEFNEEGALGLVLNRPLDLALDAVLGDKAPKEQTAQIRVYWGGPVQPDRGWLVHEDETLAHEGLTVEPGLFISNSSVVLNQLLAKNATEVGPRFRFYLGYAGWDAGQLEKEIAASSWVTAPLQRELIFSKDVLTLWEQSLASIHVDPNRLAATEPQSIN